MMKQIGLVGRGGENQEIYKFVMMKQIGLVGRIQSREERIKKSINLL